jgi:ribosomal protein L40E
MSIEPIYLIIGAVAIGGAIAGIIAVAKRGSKTPKPARQELDEYEEQYLAKEKPKRKPVEKKETSAFCENCGNTLKPTAKFCGKCGSKQ